MSIDDFPSLKLKHVHMKDEGSVLNKISTILKNGPNSLQVVTDFDLTLTKQHVDGRKIFTSFGIFKKCKQLPITYKNESEKLYLKYQPMEIDPHLSLDKKAEAMNDWIVAAANLLKGIEFDPQEIENVTKAYEPPLRDGTIELFEDLNAAQIPVLVLSAGMGDIVESILRHHNVLFSNIKIISNFLKYNGNKLDGFTNSELIHVFNKNEIASKDYLKIVKERPNVILMGDSIGDSFMIHSSVTTLKIGFLYEKAEENLKSYMECFDIVLMDDQTMQISTEILSIVLK